MKPVSSFHFGTKAQTLERLRPLVVKSEALEVFYFTVEDWTTNQINILDEIMKIFPCQLLVVRSSALIEDGHSHSMAGAFKSFLNINSEDQDALCGAITSVVDSYHGNPHDQLLVQSMLHDIAVSGVITTFVLNDGAPYYVLNYDDESGKTDTITGGTGVNKTVLIHRDTKPSLIESARVAEWLALAKDLESICGNVPLDIEFAQTHEGRLYVMQARQITVEKNWNRTVSQRITDAQSHINRFIRERSRKRPGLVGSYTILGEMPDWNPAEIIGTSPRPLASSLYRYLITDSIWKEARAQMGYRYPEHEVLMVLIGGRPYIDVRNSFNSFLPGDLDEDISEQLVDAWLERLNNHPEFHDKVEFQVAQTVLDFNFDEMLDTRYHNTLDSNQRLIFKRHLLDLTRKALDLSSGTLSSSLSLINHLEALQTSRTDISAHIHEHIDYVVQIKALLDECKTLGTMPFSIIARHAFIAETLLRSAVERGALSMERLGEFKMSLGTIMGTMSEDMKLSCNGDMDRQVFLKRYGHLRPGTYDILSLRYDQRDDLFLKHSIPDPIGNRRAFSLSEDERAMIQCLMTETGFTDYSPDHLINYAQTAIVGREYAKFIFSKNLSDALELIAEWGHHIGLTRDDMSFIPIFSILESVSQTILEDPELYYRRIADQGRDAIEMTQSLRLGYMVRDIRDIYVIPLHRAAPNFVTHKRIEGQTIVIDSRMSSFPDMYRMIVCIENADPGFDWIFTRGISGLITKFGGSNSHMAIRCAEFDLPAAIGCGEQTFDRLISAGHVELNCAAKIVRPIYE